MLKNVITYVGLVFIALLIYIFLQDYYTLAVLILIIIVPFIFVCINIVSSALINAKIQCVAISEMVHNPVKIEVNIKNGGLFPVQKLRLLFLIDDSTGNYRYESIATNLGIAEDKTITFDVVSHMATGGRVILQKINVYDWLGITYIPKNIKKVYTEYVFLPKSVLCNISLSASNEMSRYDATSYSQIRPGNDKNELFGVREYREGDSVRSIHWNLSSKKDSIVVKEYGQPLDNSLMIIADNVVRRDNKYIYQLLNKYFQTVQSVSETLVSLNCEHKIVFYDYIARRFDQITIHNNNDIHSVMQVIEKAPAPNDGDYAITGYRYKEFDPGTISGDVIYISVGADIEFLHAIKTFGKVGKVIVICVGNAEQSSEKHNFYEEAFEATNNNGFEFVSIGAEDNIIKMRQIDI